MFKLCYMQGSHAGKLTNLHAGDNFAATPNWPANAGQTLSPSCALPIFRLEVCKEGHRRRRVRSLACNQAHTCVASSILARGSATKFKSAELVGNPAGYAAVVLHCHILIVCRVVPQNAFATQFSCHTLTATQFSCHTIRCHRIRLPHKSMPHDSAVTISQRNQWPPNSAPHCHIIQLNQLPHNSTPRNSAAQKSAATSLEVVQKAVKSEANAAHLAAALQAPVLHKHEIQHLLCEY